MKIYLVATSMLVVLLAGLIVRQEADKAELKAQIWASDRAAAEEIAKFRSEFFARIAAEQAERQRSEAEARAAIHNALKALPSDDFHKTVDFPTPPRK